MYACSERFRQYTLVWKTHGTGCERDDRDRVIVADARLGLA